MYSFIHSAGGCTDVKPPTSGFTCEQQAGFGKCGADFMQGYCDLSCRRCTAGDISTHSIVHPMLDIDDCPLLKSNSVVPFAALSRPTVDETGELRGCLSRVLAANDRGLLTTDQQHMVP